MFCTMCGKELPEGANFCPHCRAEVVKIVPREEAAEASDMPVEEAGEDVPVEAAEEAVVETANPAEAAPVPEEPAAPEEASEPADEPEPAEVAGEPTNEPELDAEPTEPAEEPESAPSETTMLSAQNDGPAAETTVLPESESSEPDTDAERAEAAADAAAAERALWSASEDATDAGTTATMVLEPAHMASDEAGQDGRQPAPEAPRKKRPVALIATIALLVVAAGAFFGIFVLPRIMGKDVPTVTYGQTDPVQCSVVTRVRPRDESGSELTSYVVYLMRQASDDAASSSSASEELNQVVAEIRVTGNNGFTMENFGEVPDGDYVLVIVPNDSQGGSSLSSSNDEQRIPVHYEEDNHKAEEEIVVEPPAPEPSSPEEPAAEEDFTDEEIASALIYYTCQDLIDEYGEAGSVELHDGMEVAASGLALAERIDFDSDGMDELLTVTCTQDLSETAAFYGEDTYQIAVWRYEDGAVEQVYEGTVPHSNGGYFYLNLFEYQPEGESAQTVIYNNWYSDPTEPDTEVSHIGYYALADDGFQLLALRDNVFYYDEGRHESTYTLGGAEGTEEEWTEFEGDVEQVASYNLSMPVSDIDVQSESEDEPAFEIVDAADLPQRTEDTLTALKEDAGAEALEAFAPEKSAEAEAEEGSAEAAYTYANNEADVTFTTSQGEGTDWEETRPWTYPQFTLEDGSSTEALDALNAAFKQSYEDDLSGAQSWNFESGDVQVWEHRDEVTYLEGDIASVLSYRTIFLGGAHPSEAASGACYDLSTGEEVPVSEAFGISQDDLQTAAEDAIVAYIDSHANMSGADDASIQGMAADMTRYYATEDGIAIIVMPSEIASNAEGIQYIYVHAFNDSSLVGTSAAA